MVGHKAVLDYSKYTASFCRHGKRYTLSPGSILTDKGKFPNQVPEPNVRKSFKSLPPGDKATRRANRADQHAQYTK